MKSYKQPRCPSGGDWLNILWHIYAMEYSPATKRNQLLICAIIWWELPRIFLREKGQSHRLHTIGFCLHSILEIINLWKWRTDEWLPEVRNEGCSIGIGYDYKIATQGILELKDYSLLDSVKVAILAVILPNSFVRCHYLGSLVRGTWYYHSFSFNYTGLYNCLKIWSSICITNELLEII